MHSEDDNQRVRGTLAPMISRPLSNQNTRSARRDDVAALRSQAVAPSPGQYTHVKTVPLHEKGHIFKDSSHNDLVIYTELPEQRVLIGTDQSKKSRISVNSGGTVLRGKVEIDDELKIAKGRINMVGGFAVDTGIIVEGDATLKSRLDVLNSSDQPLFKVNDSSATVFRTLKVTNGNDLVVEGDLNLMGTIVSEDLRMENDLTVGGSLNVGPNQEFSVIPNSSSDGREGRVSVSGVPLNAEGGLNVSGGSGLDVTGNFRVSSASSLSSSSAGMMNFSALEDNDTDGDNSSLLEVNEDQTLINTPSTRAAGSVTVEGNADIRGALQVAGKSLRVLSSPNGFDNPDEATPLFEVSESNVHMACNLSVGADASVKGDITAGGDATIEGMLEASGGLRVTGEDGVTLQGPFQVNDYENEAPLFSVTEDRVNAWTDTRLWGDLSVRPGGSTAPVLLSAIGSNETVRMDAKVDMLRNIVVGSNARIHGNIDARSSLGLSGDADVGGELKVDGGARFLQQVAIEGGRLSVINSDASTAADRSNLTVTRSNIVLHRSTTVGGKLDVAGVQTSSMAGGLEVRGQEGLTLSAGPLRVQDHQLYAAGSFGPSNPSYSWTGDENTGLFLAGPDSIGVSTGGREVMRWTEDGDTDISGDLRVDGIVSGNGSGITDLNASSVNSGTLEVAHGGTGAQTAPAGKVAVGAGSFVSYPGALHWNDSNERLGIGTSDPKYALDVAAGDARVSGRVLSGMSPTSSSPAFSWSSDADTGISRPSADTLAFMTAGTERARLTPQGNLGVGTTSPAARLHVADGDLALDGTMTSGNVPASRITTGILPVERGGTGVPVLANSKLMVGRGNEEGVLSPPQLHWDDSNDRLGINTDEPRTSLDVNGVISASSFIGNGNDITDLNANAVSSGVLGGSRGGTGVSNIKKGNLVIGSWDRNDAFEQPEDLVWDGSNRRLGVLTPHPEYAIDVGGNGSVRAGSFIGDGSALTGLGADSVVSGVLDARRGGTGVSGLTAGKFLVGNGSRASSALQPQDLHWDASSNRLGVRTSHPRAALEVAGDVIAQSLSGRGAGVTHLNVNAVASGELAVARGGTGRSGLSENKLLVGRGSSQEVGQPEGLHWDFVQDRLGVGTSSPQHRLDVAGDVRATRFIGDGNRVTNLDMDSAGTGELSVERGGTGSSGLARGKLVVGDGPSNVVLQPDELHWDADRLRLGIGTDDPDSELHVSGTVTADRLVGDGNDIINLDMNSASTGSLAVARGGTGRSGLAAGRLLVGNGPTKPALVPDALFWNDSNQRLGINRMDPRTALDVEGTVSATLFSGNGRDVTNLNMDSAGLGTLAVARGGTGGAFHRADKLMVAQGSNAVLSPSQLHWDRERSRLGINTSAPSTALQVEGTVTATSFAGRGRDLFDLNMDAAGAGALAVARGGTGKSGLTNKKLVVGNGPTAPALQPDALHWDDQNQRLGIGTDTPASTLEVDGTVRASAFVGRGRDLSDLNMDSAGAGTLAVRRGGTGNSNLSAGKLLVGRGGAAVLQPQGLHWDAGTQRLGVLTEQPEAELHVHGEVRAETFVGDGRALTDLSADNFLSGTMPVSRGGTGRNVHSEDKLLVGSGAGPLRSPSDLHWDATNLRLGIGTNLPGRPLHVAGIARADTFEGSGARLSNLDMDHAASGTLNVRRGGTGASSLAEGKILVGRGTSAVLQPSGLHWNASAERLGVNTNVPGVSLDVGGGAEGVVRVSGQFLGQAQDSEIRPSFGWSGDRDTGIFRPSPDTVAITTDGKERARFTNDGRVGIGTQEPDFTLHVEGDMYLGGKLRGADMSTDRLTEGVLPVPRGGTGEGAHERNRIIVGQGTDPLKSVSSLRWNEGDDDETDTMLDVDGGVQARTFVRADRLIGDGRDVTELDADAVTRGTLIVNRGGTGARSHEVGKLLVGRGTSPIQGPSALHWDIERERLGVGTSSPSSAIDVPSGTVTAASFVGDGQGLRDLNANRVTSGTLIVERGGTGASNLTDGKMLLGRGRNAIEALNDVDWNAIERTLRIGAPGFAPADISVSGRVTAAAFTGNGNELTALDASKVNSGTLRVVHGGTGKSSHAHAKVLVGDGSNPIASPPLLHWDAKEERLGVGTSNPETRLQVEGTVRAIAFAGDGNALTNVDLNDSTTGVLDVENGGTGSVSHTAGKLIVGEGSSALSSPQELHWDAEQKVLALGDCNIDVGLVVSGDTRAASFAGVGSALRNLDADNVTLGTLIVPRGGTGRSRLPDSKLLVGRGTSAVAGPSHLHWDANRSLLRVGVEDDFGNLEPVGVTASGTVRARDFVGVGAEVRDLNVNNVSSGTLDVRYGGGGRSSHARGKLLVGNADAPFMNPQDLHWDSTARRLIIGTDNVNPATNARGRLHVDGDVHADEFVGDINVGRATKGVLAVPRGGTGRGEHELGRVLVGAGREALLNAARLIWDEPNARLGVGRSQWPRHALDVQGTVCATTRVLATSNMGHDTPDLPAFSWSGDGDTGMFRADADVIGFATRGRERVRFDRDGNVGIGTRFPDTRLHVAGDFSLNGRMVSGNLSTDRLDAGVLPVARGGTGQPSLTKAKLMVGFGTEGVLTPADLHWNTSNAFLGIGTSTPDRQLDVRGTARANFLVGDGSGVSNLDMDFAGLGILNVARGGTGRGSHTSNKLIVGSGTDGLRSPSSLHYNDDDTRLGVGVTEPREGIDVSTGVRANTRFVVNTGSDSSNRPAFSWFGDDDTGMFRPGRDVVAFSTEGIERARITARGLMGVNKTDPSSTLHVGGDVAIDGTLVSGSMSTDRLTFGELPVVRGGTSRGSIRRNKIMVGNDTDAVITPEFLHWQTDRNRLGIGTADPQDTLHVNGGARAVWFRGDGSRLTNLQISSIASALDSSTGGMFAVENGGTGRSNLTANKLMVGNDTGAVRTFSGLHWNPIFSRLGVANSDPQETLDVGGTVRASGRVLGSVAMGGAAVFPTFAWSGDVDTGIYHPFEDTIGISTAGVERMRFTDDGRVGIGGGEVGSGTLHVNGDVSMTGTLTSGSMSADRITTGVLPVRRGGTGRETLARRKVLIGNDTDGVTSAHYLHWNDDNTRLGINTDDPQATLHVRGDIISEGQVTADAFVGDGSGLTNISSSALSGTDPDGTISVQGGGTGRTSLDNNKILVGNGTGRVSFFSDFHWDGTRMGVGVSSPDSSSKLHVDGRVKAGSFEGQGSLITQLNADNFNSGVMAVNHGGTGNDGLTQNKILVGNGTDPVNAADDLHWTDDGRLGIHTDDPDEMLHVKGGKVKADGFIGDGSGLTNINISGGTSGVLGVGSGGTGKASFTDGRVLLGAGGTNPIKTDSDLHWNASAKRLGINTGSSASHTLHVSGTALVTGNTTIEGNAIHKARLVIQDGQDGGEGRGLYTWSANDSRRAIYMATSGSGRSLNSGNAVAGEGFGGMALRFRCVSGNDEGFLFENSGEERLFSIRGNDGLASFRNDVVHGGKIVVQDGQDGGTGRGIHLWTRQSTDWGVYLASSGGNNSLAGNAATDGGTFSGMAARIRVGDGSDEGFIVENKQDDMLFSIRGGDGTTSFGGDVIFDRSVSFNQNVIVGGKLVIHDGVQNGENRGLYLLSADDPSWVIYMGSVAGGTSPSGSSVIDGDSFLGMAARLRIKNDDDSGFIIENDDEQMLLSVRGNDGLTIFKGDVIHHGKIVVQDGQNGGGDRGIFMNSASDSDFGIYAAGSFNGTSLNGNDSPVEGFGNIDGTCIRFRSKNDADNGFIFENSSDDLLISVRGSDGLTNFVGNVIHHGKIVVQDGQDGGTGRGIHMWSADDTQRAIYMASSGSGKSISSGDAVDGESFFGNAIRFRINDDSGNGFIFENSSEEMLFSINGSSGNTIVGGDLTIKGDLEIEDDLDVDKNINLGGYVNHTVDGWTSYAFRVPGLFRGKYDNHFSIMSEEDTFEFYIAKWNEKNVIGDYLTLNVSYGFSLHQGTDADDNENSYQIARHGVVRLHTKSFGNGDGSAGRNQEYYIIDELHGEDKVFTEFSDFRWNLRHTGDNPGDRVLSLFVKIDKPGFLETDDDDGSESEEAPVSFDFEPSIQGNFSTEVMYDGPSWDALDFDPVPLTNDTEVGYREGIGSTTPLDDSTSGWTIAPVRRTSISSKNNFIGIGTHHPEFQLDVTETNNNARTRLESEQFAGVYLNADSAGQNADANAFLKMSTFNEFANSVLSCVRQDDTAGDENDGPFQGTSQFSTVLGTRSPHALHFGTSSQVKMTILDNGDIGIGKTDPVHALDVDGRVNADWFKGDGSNVTNLDMDNASYGILNVDRGGTGTGDLSSNRLLVANENEDEVKTPSDLYWSFEDNRLGIGTTNPVATLHVIGNIRASDNVLAESDARVKKNLHIIPDAVSKILQLTGYTFTRCDAPEKNKHVRHMGLIAQDVLKVAPEAVSYDEKSDMYAVAYGNLSALIIESVKQIIAQQKEEQNELHMLRSAFRKLESRVQELEMNQGRSGD